MPGCQRRSKSSTINREVSVDFATGAEHDNRITTPGTVRG
jgi:hypothetical protein